MRRIGKSWLLKQFYEYLENNILISDSQIQIYDLNNKILEKKYKKNWEVLYNEIISKSSIEKTNFIFIDEVQNINYFEDLLLTLQSEKKFDFDIYVTGSNSKTLSTDLSSNLTGRHYEINVLHINFLYLQNYILNNDNLLFLYEYLEYGGMGKIILFITIKLKSKCN